jgi:ABC-type multidrug transport system ATPase subunit
MADFRQMIRRMVDGEGRTVMVSSHLLDEMEKIVDYVAIVNQGTVVIEGSIKDLIESGAKGVEIGCSDPERAAQLLRTVAGVEAVEVDANQVLLARCSLELAAALNRTLVDAGFEVWRVASNQETLEQRYFDITRYGGQAGPGSGREQ